MALDSFGRPAWDDYFMALAFVAAMRSIDPGTKHGCVITRKNRIVSLGYNGPASGLDDERVPLTRPEKYPFMAHAEENAILNSDADIKGTTVYITGYPCHRCFRMLLQKQVSRIVAGPIVWQQSDEDYNATQLMLKLQKKKTVKIITYKEQGDGFLEVLKQALAYEQQKLAEKKSMAKKRRKSK